MNLIFDNSPAQVIERELERLSPVSVFMLVDTNTGRYVLPRLMEATNALSNAKVITIEAGDENKNLTTLTGVWRQLVAEGATRSSLLINVGGGMVTDLGAFAASTFKRGIRFINVPTTLLAAIDASVGGKTGINFDGLKNEIGVFNDAETVIISTIFFDTLSQKEVRSGFAEMLKHAMLTSASSLKALIDCNIDDFDSQRMLSLVEESVKVKERIVIADPKEQGLRRALNLGHTAGHAFESMAMEKGNPIPHGYAVAYGLIVSLILSHMKLGMPTDVLYALAKYVKQIYGSPSITCDDYPTLLALMDHDKKNTVSGKVNFTLLHDVGRVETGVPVTHDEIKTALDIFRDLM